MPRDRAINHLDGFLRSGDNDIFSISYYRKGDLPFIGHAARAFTSYDRFFCSLMASTYPNRYYMHAGQSFGRKDNNLAGIPFPDKTIWNALKKKGVSHKYFYSDIPVTALWGAAGIKRSALQATNIRMVISVSGRRLCPTSYMPLCSRRSSNAEPCS